jgi:hypothetical protein
VAFIPLVNLGVNNLFRVTNDCKIWIVSYNDYLASRLGLLIRWYKHSKQCLVIKIFLWLVNDEWHVVTVNQ